jgi:hypothetical protein
MQAQGGLTMETVRAGQPITYHGSIIRYHGPAVALSRCPCRMCAFDLMANGRRRYLVLCEDGVMSHVRETSFTPVEIPDTVQALFQS